jgi:valyl-tRNA synthetase
MEIPKTYEPREVEERWYPFWESRHFFSPEQNDSPDAPVFSMVIPPPNVTGYLHMGHALNHTLQDVLARWRRMSGDRVLWLPGTDHAGIATQMVVERQLAKEGISRKDLGRDEFVKRVWEWREHSGGEIQKQMRVLGESVDWTRERFTLDSRLSEAVKEVFVRLYDDGLIYRGEYLVNWSPGLQTAISDLEVEMRPVKGKLYHLAYPVRDANGHTAESTEGLAEAFAESEGKTGLIKTAHGEFVLVATTRPETMLGDTAVAFNPEDERYLNLKDRLAVLPLVGRELKFVEDAVVEKDFGTGLVKVTPAHDPNDFAIGKRHELEYITVIGKDAKITDSAPAHYRGLDRYDARTRVLADLESAGLLLKVEEHLHNVGHCQRSGVVVEPLISTQWFMRMKTLAEPALEAARDGRTRFVPENMTKTYSNWLENIEDWCISRQLWWGHRIPAWYDDKGTVVVARSEAEAQATYEAKGGSAGTRLSQDEDVLDTWFSSALWPFSTLGWPEETEDLKAYYPTTVLITGPDIIFFWVARMMMMGLKFMGDVPFRTVYINGLVLDPEGQKMSKTKGNVIDPLVIFEKYGTDAARFALASAATPGMPISLQESKLEAARNFANKIWNATRFVFLNCGEELGGGPLDWETEMAPPELADRWILSRFNRIALDVNDALADFRVHEAASLVYHFFWDDFCDWYIELSKPFVTSREGGSEAIAARRRLIYMLERSLRLLHPIMPFISEELWQRMPRTGETISLAEFPHANAAQVDGRAEKEMSFIIDLVTRLRSIRSTFNIGQSTALEARIAPANEEHRSLIESMSGHICRLARVGKLELVDAISKERGFARAVIPGAEIEIPLAGLIDFEKERERLERELARLKGEKDGLEKRLSNEDFIKRAAPDVVAATQSRASEIDGQLERLRGMIEAL